MSRSDHKAKVWTVVVDDDALTAHTLADRLGDHIPVFHFTDPEVARRFLKGDRSVTRTPVPDDEPLGVVVLIDLFMGHRAPCGVHTIAMLREHSTPIAAVIRSSELDSGRELIAVSCAEAWRAVRGEDSIPYLPKDASPQIWQSFESGVSEWERTLEAGDHSAPRFEGLVHIKPLIFRNESGRTTTFLKWLTKTAWRLPLLTALSQRRPVAEAMDIAGLDSWRPADVDDQLRPLLAAHDAMSPSGSWLAHDGLLDYADALKIDPDLANRAGESLTLVRAFAHNERFLLVSPGLQEAIRGLGTY